VESTYIPLIAVDIRVAMALKELRMCGVTEFYVTLVAEFSGMTLTQVSYGLKALEGLGLVVSDGYFPGTVRKKQQLTERGEAFLELLEEDSLAVTRLNDMLVKTCKLFKAKNTSTLTFAVICGHLGIRQRARTVVSVFARNNLAERHKRQNGHIDVVLTPVGYTFVKGVVALDEFFSN